LGKIINLESASKDRTRLIRSIVLALRKLANQADISEETKDLVAFTVVSLHQVYVTVDSSVLAWEKRGYWVKADRFRLEWVWTEDFSIKLKKALFEENWGEVAGISARIMEKLQSVNVPKRISSDEPWIGSWKNLLAAQKG
jgi:hypothetical protein